MRKPYAVALDLVLVLLFAVLGRSAHHESLAPMGVLRTAWPFLIGCIVGWIVVATMMRRLNAWQAGLVIWIDTLVLGMLLRLLGDDGAHWSFVVVAAVALLVLLVGWRVVWWFARGRRLERERRERRRRRAAAALADPGTGGR